MGMTRTEKQVREAISRMETGKCHTLECPEICAKIEWLWTWRKITKEVMQELTGRIIYIMDNGMF